MGRIGGKVFQVEGIICMKPLWRKRGWHILGTEGHCIWKWWSKGSALRNEWMWGWQGLDHKGSWPMDFFLKSNGIPLDNFEQISDILNFLFSENYSGYTVEWKGKR